MRTGIAETAAAPIFPNALAAADRAQEAAALAATHATKVAEKVAIVAERVEDVHLATNGMKAALEDAAFARGKLEGKAEGTA